MDVLSDVLQTIRLQGAFFLNGEFREPWCVDAPGSAQLAQVLLPGAERLAICHLVLEGRCWVRLHDGPPVALAAGDAAVLPHGDSHLIGSGLQHAPASIDHVVQLKIPELARVHYGGAGGRCIIVCGWFAWERDLPNPLVATLPRLFCASLGRRPAGLWIEQSIRHALDQTSSHDPGSGAVAARVAELLFVEALRGYLEALPEAETGWLAGLRDPQVGRCLALLHADPAHDWSAAELARQTHLSRSMLALRFTEFVGTPPMHYLKRWRLALAARLLCNGRNTLSRIAECAGYESQAAFNRAFRREFSLPPGQWRRDAGAACAARPLASATP